MLIAKTILVAVLLIVVRLPSSNSFFDKLPTNADIFVSSDNSEFFNVFLKSSNNSDQFGVCGPTLSVVHPTEVTIILEKVHDPSSNFLSLLLNLSNNSDTFTVLNEISRFYSDESKLKRPLTIFIIMSSPTEIESLQLELVKGILIGLPWEVVAFLIELDDSNNIISLVELIAISITPTTKQFLPKNIEPDFFATFLSRRSKEDLHGSVVGALAVDNADERYSAEFDKNGSSLSFFDGGYTVSLLGDLRDTLNFSVEAVAGKDYIIDDSANNTVGGIGAQLINHEADLIISMSYALEFRLKFLSPTVAFNKDQVRVFFRQPTQFLQRNIFLHPFSDMAWVALSVTLGLIAISTFVVAKLHVQFRLGHWNENANQKYFWILGCLCQKSCSSASERIPGRILLLVTFIMSWLLFTFYSASVISRLSVTHNPITTLTGLISAKYKLLADPLVSYSKFLQLTSSTQDWEKTFVNEVDAVSKVFQGGHGFISSIDLVVIAARNLGHSEQDICDTLSSVSFFDIEMPLHFYTRKGYQFKDLINRKLLNAIEKGLNYRYRKEFLWHTNPVCPVMTQITFESLGLSDVYSVFFGLASIYFVTLIMLIIEKRVSKFRNEPIVSKESMPNNFKMSQQSAKKITTELINS